MKHDFFLILTFLILPPFLMILIGTINIFQKEWCWRLAEWMLRDLKPQRTPEWEKNLKANGILLLVAGLAILGYVLARIPRLLQP